VVRILPERAAQYGERLASGVAVRIEPGQHVVVFGPRMRERLLARNIPVVAQPAQDGFGFAVMRPETFKAYATILERRARREFDAAVACGAVTDTARDALAIMRNSSVGQLRDHLLRTLVLHRLSGDVDQFRRVLRLASRRLRDEPEQLKKAVDEHLEFVQSCSPEMPRSPAVKIHKATSGLSLKSLYGPVVFKMDGERGNVITGDEVSPKSLFPTLPPVTIDDSKELTNWIVSEE
jgi:hypothetical protein